MYKNQLKENAACFRILYKGQKNTIQLSKATHNKQETFINLYANLSYVFLIRGQIIFERRGSRVFSQII